MSKEIERLNLFVPCRGSQREQRRKRLGNVLSVTSTFAMVAYVMGPRLLPLQTQAVTEKIPDEKVPVVILQEPPPADTVTVAGMIDLTVPKCCP